MWLKEYVAKKRAERHFPKGKDEFWYCGDFYNYQGDLLKAGKTWKGKDIQLPCEVFLIDWPKYYRRIEEGAILPCIKLDGWIGFYKITKKWRYSSAGSDFASWDDGYNVNLEFHHCERDEVPR